MLRRPCCGPVLGNGSKRPPGSSGRSSVASCRSRGEPAGRCPTATWRCRRDHAAGPSNRCAGEPESPPPPHPATPTRASPTRAAPRSALALGRGLLALALDARLRCDRRHRGLVMATGTIPDHICLGDPLLGGLRLDLGPRELRFGEVVPSGEIESLQRALQCRPPVLLRAEHRPDYLKLLVAESDDPHVASSRPNLNFRERRAL